MCSEDQIAAVVAFAAVGDRSHVRAVSLQHYPVKRDILSRFRGFPRVFERKQTCEAYHHAEREQFPRCFYAARKAVHYTLRLVFPQYVHNVFGAVAGMYAHRQIKFPCQFKLFAEKTYLTLPVISLPVVVKPYLSDSGGFRVHCKRPKLGEVIVTLVRAVLRVDSHSGVHIFVAFGKLQIKPALFNVAAKSDYLFAFFREQAVKQFVSVAVKRFIVVM